MMMCLAIQPDNLAIIPEMRSMREKRNGNLMADFVLEGNGNRDTSYSSFVSFNKNYFHKNYQEFVEASFISLNKNNNIIEHYLFINNSFFLPNSYLF